VTSTSSDQQVHPDLDAEQRWIDHAYACLGRMHDKAVYLFSLGYPGFAHSNEDVREWELASQRRIDSLADSPSALCFGRIDESEGRFYIGRRHVEDEPGNPVVTDWRAPVSAAFYRATVTDPMGLSRRRRFLLDDKTIADIIDEDLAHPTSVMASSYVPDPLLAEITRTRTGEMRDIVATIAAEQDVIIRAPLEGTVIVQGGPGTGKTAVGLHRAAFLLYEHREALERDRVLILGPNPIFLRYISQVLPSLGETAAQQLSVDSLAGVQYRVGLVDGPEVARLKGDLRMAEVVLRSVGDQLGTVAGDVSIPTRFGPARLAAEEILEVVTAVAERRGRVNIGRTAVRDRLIQQCWAAYSAGRAAADAQRPMFEEDVRTSSVFKAALDRTWPAMTPAGVVRRLYGNRSALQRAAAGVLDAEELSLLHRRPARRASDQRWTVADLALLDEVEALLNGVSNRYGHIVVDEAQDLSAMALRRIARRSRRASMTILGDLAQATAPAGQTSWAGAIEALNSLEEGPPASVQLDELTIGYRVPGPIMDMANQLLPEAAPMLRPARSVRLTGQPPRLIATPESQRASVAATAVAELAERVSSIAVVAPEPLLADVGQALSGAGIEFMDARRYAGLGDRVTLLAPGDTKGLEFDAVVAVEPAHIHGLAAFGPRLLYVVLTRAVQELVIVHSDPLPRILDPSAAGA
jgi:DNA helicase IV